MEQSENVKHYTHAGFWIRLGANIIDFIVLLPLAALNIYNFLNLKSMIVALLVILLSTAYKPLLEYYWGATLGKKAVNLKVLDVDYNPIDFQMAIERYVPWLISVAVSLFVIFVTFGDTEFADVTGFIEMGEYQKDQGFSIYQQLSILPILLSAIFIFFNKQRQALHDQYAGTYVVYTDR